MPTPNTSPMLAWQCRNRRFDCGARTLVFGILNVTPDSFSDGGNHNEPDAALRQAQIMIEQGADFIDIGGESTRPGSAPVPLETELNRVVPVIERIRSEFDIPISVDTTKAQVARAALEAGADAINDISAMRQDPAMPEVVAQTGAGIILMHMQGTPRDMQKKPQYEDAVVEVGAFFEERVEAAIDVGINPESICLDPGIGFGKRLEHNLALIDSGGLLRALGYPVLVGLSRKSFINTIHETPLEHRLEGSLAGGVAAVLQGADMLRVHDVAPTVRALRVADAIKKTRKAKP